MKAEVRLQTGGSLKVASTVSTSPTILESSGSGT